MGSMRRRDYGSLIMWSAVVVSMPRWAGAFIAADTVTISPIVDEVLHLANLVAGAAMGPIEVLGAAYLLDAWGKMKPRKTWNAKSLDHRWKVLTVFVAGLFILMPLILSPYIYVRMNSLSLAALPAWFQAVWSIAVVWSPAFLVGGVAVAREGLVTSDGPYAGAYAGIERAEPAVPTVRKRAEQANPLYECEACGRSFGSGQGLNAHRRFCTGALGMNGQGVKDGVHGDQVN